MPTARSYNPHRQPHHGPEASTDGERRAEAGDDCHAQDRPRRRLRRMGRSRPMAVYGHMAVVMAVGVVMDMAVDARTGHKSMLYYNITSVYLGESFRDLRPPDGHRDGRSHERKWQRHRGAEPDKARGHEGDLPQQQPLKSEQRPGNHIGHDLRRAPSALQEIGRAHV